MCLYCLWLFNHSPQLWRAFQYTLEQINTYIWSSDLFHGRKWELRHLTLMKMPMWWHLSVGVLFGKLSPSLEGEAGMYKIATVGLLIKEGSSIRVILLQDAGRRMRRSDLRTIHAEITAMVDSSQWDQTLTFSGQVTMELELEDCIKTNPKFSWDEKKDRILL